MPARSKSPKVFAASALGSSYWWYQARQDWVARAARRFCAQGVQQRTLRSLDLGCGAGGTVERLRDWGEAWGIEPDPAALALARRQSSQPAQFIRGRMEHMPFFKTGAFDFATCLDVLEHTLRPGEALREAKRVLKAHGILLATVPGDPKLWSSRDARLGHYRRYTPGTLKRELETAGFEVLYVSYINAFYYWPFRGWLAWRRWQQKNAVPEIQKHTFETSPFWSAVWRAVLNLETQWWLRWPWGVSVAAVARKPGEEAAPYPQTFVFGCGQADPREWSLRGLKINRALRALRDVQGRVLEIGCGGGQYLRGLRQSRPDLKLAGVDLDPVAVRAAQGIPGTRVIQADAARLPFKNISFSAMVGFDILEHMPNPARVLTEAARVLKPGGVLHLYVPCEGNPGTVYARRGHALKARWGGHAQFFTAEDLIGMLRRAGFSVVQTRYADYALAQAMDFAFYQKLSCSPRPEVWWAGQALAPGGGARGLVLRTLRRLASFLAWAESQLRSGRAGSMGVHLTAVKAKSKM